MLYGLSEDNLDKGILLVRINEVWGAVRYDTSFVPNGANAACRAMGYTEAKSVSKTLSKYNSQYNSNYKRM